MKMKAIEPYWNPTSDLSEFLFHINKVERTDFTDFPDVPQTVLPFFSFVYLQEGEVLLEIEGKPYLCQGRQFLMVPANVAFKVLHFNKNVGFECGFSIRMLKDVSYACLHSPNPLHQSFEPEDAAFTWSLLELLYKAQRENHKEKNCALIQSAMDLFLCRLVPQKDYLGNGTVSRFLEMVFDRNARPMKVAEYASALCITPNYLNRLVRAHTRHSAMDWIEISRLNLAKLLLKQNRFQISEIAEAVGIDDQSYFTRFFKKYEGCTPSQFRDRILNR